MFVPMKRPSQNFLRKLLTRARKGRTVLAPILWPKFPRKSVSRSIATCARGMGGRTPRTTPRIVIGMRMTERRNPSSMLLRKAIRKLIFANQNFAQLSEKLDKLEKALKKLSKKAKKRHYKDSNSDSE